MNRVLLGHGIHIEILEPLHFRIFFVLKKCQQLYSDSESVVPIPNTSFLEEDSYLDVGES